MTLSKIINQNNTALIDVREPSEFSSVRAKGAVNIPLRTIPERIEDFKKMQKPIVVYCASGNRSGQALNYLKAQGIEDIYNGGGVFQVMGMQQ